MTVALVQKAITQTLAVIEEKEKTITDLARQIDAAVEAGQGKHWVELQRTARRMQELVARLKADMQASEVALKELKDCKP